eukprot:TsM_000385200 transcript=TsM_000385200 gene=TsM_000385200
MAPTRMNTTDTIAVFLMSCVSIQNLRTNCEREESTIARIVCGANSYISVSDAVAEWATVQPSRTDFFVAVAIALVIT